MKPFTQLLGAALDWKIGGNLRRKDGESWCVELPRIGNIYSKILVTSDRPRKI